MKHAAAAPADVRIEFRDRIAGFGSPAIIAMQRWVDDGRPPGFAIAVIEAVGRATDPVRALSALRGLRTRLPDWIVIIDAANARVDAARRSSRD